MHIRPFICRIPFVREYIQTNSRELTALLQSSTSLSCHLLDLKEIASISANCLSVSPCVKLQVYSTDLEKLHASTLTDVTHTCILQRMKVPAMSSRTEAICVSLAVDSKSKPRTLCQSRRQSLFTSDTDPEPLDAGTLLIDPKTGQLIAGSSSDNPFYYDKVFAEPTSDGDRKRKYQQSEMSEEYVWRACDQRCENLPSQDPRDHTYIDLVRPVQEALVIIRRMVENSYRVGPLNLCRMPRGGKTTLLRALFDTLNTDPEFYPIIISAAGYDPSSQKPLEDIVHQIASQLAEHLPNMYSLASVGEQLTRIQKETQRRIVLLVDDLDSFGNPVHAAVNQYLIKVFLDVKERYLVYTSCLTLRFGGISECRMTKFVQMPVCTNRALLHTLPHAEGLDDLLITITGGIPSLIGLELSRRAGCGQEKSLKEVFLGIVGANYDEHKGPFDAQRGQVQELLHTLLLGSPSVLPFFERFADHAPILASESRRFPFSHRVRYPLAYIPLILCTLGEEDAYSMYQDLYSAAEQQGDLLSRWVLVITLAVYTMALVAKYIPLHMIDDVPVDGPFHIAQGGMVTAVHYERLPPLCQTLDTAYEFIHAHAENQAIGTIVMFRCAETLQSAPLPFNLFLVYCGINKVNIHGIRCTVQSDELPTDPPVPAWMQHAWLLRHTTEEPVAVDEDTDSSASDNIGSSGAQSSVSTQGVWEIPTFADLGYTYQSSLQAV